MSWPRVPITKVARVVGGATPKTDNPSFWGGHIDWATPKDLSDLREKFISSTPRKITDAGLRGCAAEVLPAGSVLFSSRAPIGHIAINAVPMATNQGFKSFVPGPELDASFLYWWLDANRERLQAMGTGATFKEVSKAVVERIEIPLPPLEEQRRIAAILDQADALRRLRTRALDKLNTLGHALFHEMFGDPGLNSRNWRTLPIGDAVERISDGPFGSNLKSSHYVDRGVRVWRLQNIGVGEIIDSDKAFISEEHFVKLKKHECNPGDVIVGTLGDPNLRACIQPENIPVALNKADCVQIRPNDDVAVAEYWVGLLNHPSTLKLAHSAVLGQTRSRISMGRLKKLQVPVPDICVQRDYQARMAMLRGIRAPLHSQVEAGQRLFESLQHRAFKGEL
ncbi:restriction endonuclease subunit S [Stappia sp. P2PMeth1]|uniref:restriction endonuclease subunit S n=1 Tax=Stappia sp. P2PMeth1 TaxID=2003586 RepID=UPI0016493A42|nr:restriction endonuclease subunit S [Stappia sp. P2PMeth1]